MEGRPKISRKAIIQHFHELMDASEYSRKSIKDFSKSIEVSERTLRSVFSEFYGISPFRYIQLRVLHNVHTELRLANPKNTTVAEVLVNNGQWEFGRFASRFHKLFGELPSKTLARVLTH